MAYRSPVSAHARRNTIRRQISDNINVQAQDDKQSEKVLPENAKEEHSEQSKHTQERRVKNNPLTGIFGSGKPDNDKIIIIALIVILAREGADIKLLLALGYILM